MASARQHEEAWRLLPWLANGRLPQAQRVQVEEHVRECAQCAQELSRQQLIRAALCEPERVTYAPGPSLRKLMDRIDGRQPAAPQRPARPPVAAARAASAWRPPGLAWAASFALATVLSGLAVTAWHWSQPAYVTYTASPPPAARVLHIAFVPTLSVAEAGEVLRAAGARVIDGPDATGIVAIAPVAAPGERPDSSAGASALSSLAARLRADARVRWIEPRFFPAPERPPPPP